MVYKYVICLAVFLTCLILFPKIVTGQEDSGILWLVNRENQLPSNFRPDDLVKYKNTELRLPARDAFEKMLAAMESDNVYGLRLQSAFRPYAYQQAIFNERVRELMKKGHSRDEAALLTLHSIQTPGASEHQLGLALDVSINGCLTEDFANTAAGQWLEENCYKFGFIIRYPEHKTSVTGIIYEPWHLRYVGIPHSVIMKECDLILEEYHRFIAEVSMYIVWGESGEYCLVSHVQTLPEEIPANVIDISQTKPETGDGYIITKKSISLNPQQ